MQSDKIRQAAELLVNTRRSGERLVRLPEGLEPQNADEGYAVQEAVIALQGPPASWKLGAPKLGIEPKCAPVSGQFTFTALATLGRGALLQSPKVEVEIGARFARDLPPRATPYTTEEVADAIASLDLALEVISSRFSDQAATNPFSVLADAQSNGAIVHGTGISNWRAIDLSKVSMTLSFDGQKVAETNTGASNDLVLHDLTWLANHVAKRVGGLRNGQIAITGARTSPLLLPPGFVVVSAMAPLIGSVVATFLS